MTVNPGLRIPLGFLIASSVTVFAWGGESSSATSDSAEQPVLPQQFLDPNFLNYGSLKSDFSSTGGNFTSPTPPRSAQKGVGFDFKTEYEVNIDKFLPSDGFPLYGPIANGNPQNGSAQKKTPVFLGLSVTKPLN
jgi:hypothetical protein